MAFSLFNKKGGEPPPKDKVGASPPKVPAGPSPSGKGGPAAKPGVPTTPRPAALAAEGLSSKINEIEAEMDALDFTALAKTPTAARPQLPSDLPPTVQAELPVVAIPAAGAPAARPAAPTDVVKSAVASAAAAASAAAVPARSTKPVIEHGFNPALKSASAAVPPVAASAPVLAPAPSKVTASAVTRTIPPVAEAQKSAAPIDAGVPDWMPDAAVQPVPVPATGNPATASALTAKNAPRSDPGLGALGVSSVMMRELALSPFEAAPVLEQAALLHAEGKSVDARAALEAALQQGGLPPAAANEAWMLLFDVLEILGEAAVFEAAAIDYAVAFETSPPPFVNRSSVSDPMLETGGGQYYAINGALDAAIAPQLARLGEIAARSKIMRIEFGKIKAVTEPGCILLLERLRSFRKSGLDLVFSNIAHLTGLLGQAIETGRRSDPEVYWLLLLELLQFQGLQEAFEEAALNYCITYEVSPPQWAASARKAAAIPSTTAPAPAAAALPADALYLKGAVRGQADPRLTGITQYAEGRKLVIIDLFDLRRFDPAAASEFINVLSALYVKGVELELRNPCPLVATLLISMGFTEQARFTKRAA